MLHMLNLVEKFDFVGEGRTGLNVHRLIESMKCAYTATEWTLVSDAHPLFSSWVRGSVGREVWRG